MAKGGKRRKADGRLRVIAGGAPKVVLPGPGPKRPSSSAPAAAAQPKSGPPNKRRESPEPGEVEENAPPAEEASPSASRGFPRWGLYAIGALIAAIAAYFVLRKPTPEGQTLPPGGVASGPSTSVTISAAPPTASSAPMIPSVSATAIPTASTTSLPSASASAPPPPSVSAAPAASP